MKVVREIIWYLNGRGLLSGEDLRHLRTRGFIDHGEEIELVDGPAASPAAAAGKARRTREADDVYVDPEDVLAPRTGRRRKARRMAPALEPLAGIVAGRIEQQWPVWNDVLVPLFVLAARVQPLGSLEQAINVIRRAPALVLDGAVVAAAREARPALPRLWSALELEAYRDGIVGADEHGPAVVAYHAIVDGAGAAELGSYAAVLKHPGFARLLGLVQAQRAVLRSVGRALAADPAGFDRALFARQFQPVCYWALTMLVSGLVLERPGWPLRVHVPARPQSALSDDQVRAAWSCAGLIDSRLTTRLLVELSTHDIDSCPDSQLPIRCPQSWDRGYFVPAHADVPI